MDLRLGRLALGEKASSGTPAGKIIKAVDYELISGFPAEYDVAGDESIQESNVRAAAEAVAGLKDGNPERAAQRMLILTMRSLRRPSRTVARWPRNGRTLRKRFRTAARSVYRRRTSSSRCSSHLCSSFPARRCAMWTATSGRHVRCSGHGMHTQQGTQTRSCGNRSSGREKQRHRVIGDEVL